MHIFDYVGHVSSYKYFMYGLIFIGFRFMFSFTYFIVCWGYFKIVYEFIFLIYLVMGHMHWISHDYERSSSIWNVSGRIIHSCYIYFILFIHLFFILIYLFIYLFFSPQIIVFNYFFVHILEKWRYRWKKRIGIRAGCASNSRHRDIGVYEICGNRRKKTKRWW